MPRLEEILSDKNKEKLMGLPARNKLTSTGNKTIKGPVSVVQQFTGTSDKTKLPSRNRLSSTGNDTIKNASKVKHNFIGQTPNLNSSLGVNAADGTSVLEQNKDTITDILTGAIGGILGGNKTTTTTNPYNPAPQTESKKILGMPSWLFWVLISIIILIILIVVIRKMSR